MIKSVYGIYKNYSLIKNNTKKEIKDNGKEEFFTFKNLDGLTSSYRPILIATGINDNYDKGHQLTKKK